MSFLGLVSPGDSWNFFHVKSLFEVHLVMYSNNSEVHVTKSHFHEFLQAKMAIFSKLPLAKVLFLPAIGH